MLKIVRLNNSKQVTYGETSLLEILTSKSFSLNKKQQVEELVQHVKAFISLWQIARDRLTKKSEQRPSPQNEHLQVPNSVAVSASPLQPAVSLQPAVPDQPAVPVQPPQPQQSNDQPTDFNVTPSMLDKMRVAYIQANKLLAKSRTPSTSKPKTAAANVRRFLIRSHVRELMMPALSLPEHTAFRKVVLTILLAVLSEEAMMLIN